MVTITAVTTLTAQEEAIESGKKALHENVTDLVMRILDAIRDYGPPRVSLDRAVPFTESFQETEGQPLVLRWAIVYPELDGSIMPAGRDYRENARADELNDLT